VGTALDGRTLALFTSYDMLRQCARLAGPALEAAGIRLLVQGESGSRDLILRTFRKGERHVLFGTHSFWEGVDVVGDALSCVILARLPFASPGDPVLSARCEQLEQEGKSAFRALALPAAVLRLRQGFGRLIRHRGDRGLVVIADTRILSKNYGAIFRRSLPSPVLDCPDTNAFQSHVADATTHLLPPGSDAVR
jgi:ATP-dependent DNA helicase DinG